MREEIGEASTSNEAPPTQENEVTLPGSLPRQLTFGMVQSDPSATDLRNRIHLNVGNDQAAELPLEPSVTTTQPPDPEAEPLCVQVPWLDVTGLCYSIISLSMIFIGIAVTAIITSRKLEPDKKDGAAERTLIRCYKKVDSTFCCYCICGSLLMFAGFIITYYVVRDYHMGGKRIEKGSAAQLWIVGPIFIVSGILVLLKAFTHIYKRIHPPPSPIARHGDMLRPDTRASLGERNSLPPPTYSVALGAPVPSDVREVEDDPPKPSDSSTAAANESLALVTLNFESALPTYDEAVIRNQRRQTMEPGTMSRPPPPPIRSVSDYALRRHNNVEEPEGD